ncbi:MAG: polymorphic toxin-type HINT domain-containing protein, partial [Spirulinaceae cyanobacterium]
WVIADDPTTPGGVAPKQVMNTLVRRTEALVDLYVDGEVISTTGEHPFWVADKGWVEAKDLQVGDLLQTDEETFVDVDRIEKREGNFEVYNFDVEGFSTYFVSDLGVLVHNAGYGNDSSFPNLDPTDVPNPNIPRYEVFFDGKKWRTKAPLNKKYTPDGLYNFVVKGEKTYISRTSGGHIDISGGTNVDFAGQVRFGKHKKKGTLKYWNNHSGHYRPPAYASSNAPFDPELFKNYDWSNTKSGS